VGPPGFSQAGFYAMEYAAKEFCRGKHRRADYLCVKAQAETLDSSKARYDRT
jgi:hypothetical protein